MGIVPYMPIALTAVLVDHPDLTWIQGVQFFPPFTPSILMIRLAVTQVPWWEVVLALCLLAGSVGLTARFAARVFETAIFMYGKTASLREIWRWGVRRTPGR